MLMAFRLSQVMMGNVPMEVYEYVFVCCPIVVIGAPLGSVVGSHFHRLVLAALIYLLDTIALVTAFIIVPQSAVLTSVSVGIVLVGFAFFYLLTHVGNKIMEKISEEDGGKEEKGEGADGEEEEEHKGKDSNETGQVRIQAIHFDLNPQ